MSQLIEVKVPDIGDFSNVPVIEVFVKPGDAIKAEDAIVTLESDKATMDVPSPVTGIVKEINIKTGDTVSEGTLLIKVDTSTAPAAAITENTSMIPAPTASANANSIIEVTVPDIGDFSDVPIIELFVKPGDTIKAEDAICTLESDKATMDVPSSAGGTIEAVLVKVGDTVSQGTPLIRIAGSTAAPAAASIPAPAVSAPVTTPAPTPVTIASGPASATTPAAALPLGARVHASPSVRAYARQLGVDLAQVRSTGPKNRILREDIIAFVKAAMTKGHAVCTAGSSLGGGLDLLPWPNVDFAKFGEIEVKPLSRIKKISGQNLARNWVMIPAVTYHEDADITDLEAFRILINKENEKTGNKLTMLAFLIKASVKALQQFPEFNTSLDGDNLIYKKYFNIAFAADTPNGLVVPVVKNADQKGVFEIASENAALAKKAREGKLTPAEMSGACFTISSLGGIGGTYFAPIINAPEVAILGVNKSIMKPVWDGKAFQPRLTLPLSLTADHRVIDGALATRFNVYIAQLLADFRRAML